MLLVDRIKALEVEIDFLISKIEDLSKNTEQKHMGPTSIVGGVQNRGLLSPADIETGLGPIIGNGVIWNNGELNTPPANAEAPAPTKGYNKHTHSRYSGGAIIKQNFEIVEYDPVDWVTVPPRNPHSQQFWQTNPKIRTTVTSDPSHKTVEMIGTLDVIFNPDAGTDSNGNPIGKWGVATLEIDVRKCNFVQRRTEDGDGQKAGDIQKDSNGNLMQGPLWNSDQTKTSIIWDEDSQVWRLYAAFAPGTPTGE